MFLCCSRRTYENLLKPFGTIQCEALIDQLFEKLMVSVPLEARYNLQVLWSRDLSFIVLLPVIHIPLCPSSRLSRARRSYHASPASSTTHACGYYSP